MSDGNRVQLAMVAESSYGVTPATPGFSILRDAGNTLSMTKEVFKSAERRSDRQISDLRHGARKIGGGIDFELSYTSWDTALQALLMGTWSGAVITAATTISAAATDNSFNDSASGFLAAGFRVGHVVVASGFTGNVANNASRVVTSVTAGKMIFAGTDGDTIADDDAGEAVTLTTAATSQILKAGTTRRSFTFEQYHADLLEADYPYHRFTGGEFDTFSLKGSPNGIVTGSFGIIGQDLVLAGTAIASSTYAAASTTSPFDSITGTLEEGGIANALVTEWSIDLKNNLGTRYVCGSQTTLQPYAGESDLTGSLSMQFTDETYLNKFINETESSFRIKMQDAAGNAMRFTVPRLKYSGATKDVKGNSAGIIVLPFQGLRDTVTGTNLLVDRDPV